MAQQALLHGIATEDGDAGATDIVLLVRHGRSAHTARGWMNADALHRWLTVYDEVGIRPDDIPPARLQERAKQAGAVVSSDIPRAVLSAVRLVPDRPVQTSSLLREVPMRIPPLGGMRLPLAAWALAIGMSGAYRRLRGVAAPEQHRKQGRAAADWLSALAADHRSVVAVTHGNVRPFIAAALCEGGWTRVAGGARYAPWGAWIFARVTRVANPPDSHLGSLAQPGAAPDRSRTSFTSEHA